MTDTGWFLLIALAALSLATMAVRGVAELRGRDLYARGLALLFAGLAGGMIAASIDSGSIALGVVCGVACVELGPPVLTGVRRVITALSRRV